MWILPRNLPTTASGSPPSAPEVQDSILESDWRFEALARSCTWRSKPSPSRLWFRRWKTDSSIQLLFGRIVEPSIAQRGVDAWISSLAGTPASRSLRQDNGAAKTTRGISGLTCDDTSKLSGRATSSAKTSPHICPRVSTPSSESFTSWVTALRRHCLLLRKSVLRTSGSGSSSWPNAWPTATVSDSRSAARGTTTTGVMHPGTMLTDAVRQWGTPTVQLGVRRGAERNEELLLTGQAKSWPTPMQSDALRGSGTYKRGNLTLTGEARLWPTPVAAEGPNRTQSTVRTGREGQNPGAFAAQWMAPLLNGTPVFPTPSATPYGTSQNEGSVPHERRTRGTPSMEHRVRHGALPSHLLPTTSTGGGATSTSTLVLNPRFVEALMGWPTAWTSFGCSATESYRSWRQLHSHAFIELCELDRAMESSC